MVYAIGYTLQDIFRGDFKGAFGDKERLNRVYFAMADTLMMLLIFGLIKALFDAFIAENGTDGIDGVTPHIGLNGNWFIGDTDTGIPATGPAGQDGYTPVKGVDYFDGEDGQPGADGTSTYTYVAYASDNTGTGFSLSPTDLLKYRAEIQVQTQLTPPTSTDFASAVWVKYLGDDGSGGGGTSIDVHILFEEDDVMTYICPYDMKLTGKSASASIDADASVNDEFSQYGEITVTATEAGLITLTFEFL